MDENDISYERYAYDLLVGIVSNPSAIIIDRTTDEMGVLLSVTVAPEDMGMVIGVAGRTITAIKALVKVVGARCKARVSVRLNEPNGGKYSERPQ